VVTKRIIEVAIGIRTLGIWSGTRSGNGQAETALGMRMGDEGDTITPSSMRSRIPWSCYSFRNESKFETSNHLTTKKLDCTTIAYAVVNDGSGASSARVRTRFYHERWIWSITGQ
jgi:hypothetical protein